MKIDATRFSRAMLALITLTAALTADVRGQFVMFPKTRELTSPDGRFVVRNSERQGAASEFVGTFNALWLIDSATSRSRKLCEYFGVAALAWSSGNMLVMTEYFRTNSRVFVFSAEGAFEQSETQYATLLDKSALTRVLPVDIRDNVRENDHIFIEASGLKGNILELRIWGHGQHNPGGFLWRCEYVMSAETISCGDERARHVDRNAPTP